MYHHVLLALAPDHDETLPALVQVAEGLADPHGKITVVTVLEPIPNHIAKHLPPDQQSRHLQSVQDTLPKSLPSGRALMGIAKEGEASAVLLEVAQAEGVDCLLIASHRPGLRDYVLGSTALQVVRHARCSVHVMRNHTLLTN